MINPEQPLSFIESQIIPRLNRLGKYRSESFTIFEEDDAAELRDYLDARPSEYSYREEKFKLMSDGQIKFVIRKK